MGNFSRAHVVGDLRAPFNSNPNKRHGAKPAEQYLVQARNLQDLYRIVCSLSDAADTLLLALYPDTTPSISLSPSDVEDAYKNRKFLGPGVYLMAPPAVLKFAQDAECDGYVSEYSALNMLLSNTKIPVPCPRRVVNHKEGPLLVMDYIRGQTLDKVWKTSSLWTKIRVAFVLRRYIRQLRRLQAPPGMPPGPIPKDPASPRLCDCPSIFGEIIPTRGPFASYAELSGFWNRKQKVALKQIPLDDPIHQQKFDDSFPLVFCHMDLNPRNILLGEDGRVWLIDWAWSGFYPPWFEYLAMRDRVDNESLSGFKDSFWEAIIPFVCDPFFKQEAWYFEVQSALNYSAN